MVSITRQTVTLCHYPMFTQTWSWFKHRTCLYKWCPHTSGWPHIWNTSQCTILQQMPQFTHDSTLKKNQQIHPAIYTATYSETPISHNAQTGAVYIHHHTLFIGVSSTQSHTPTHDFLKNYRSFSASRTSNLECNLLFTVWSLTMPH